MLKLRMAATLLAGALILALAGCSATEFSRNLEDVIGGAARTKIQRIGAASYECYFVKLNISKGYAVVLPRRILRLGEEFTQASVGIQFSGGGVDYAVIQGVRADGSVENFLLQVFSSNRIEMYRLDSSSRSPFSVNTVNGEFLLIQDADGGMVRYWLVSPSSVRGPSMIARSKVGVGSKTFKSSGKGTAKSGKSSKKASSANVDLPMADLPTIQQDTSMKLEVDNPPQSAAPAPAANTEPVVVGKSKVSSGAAQAPASSGGSAKPYTIVVD